MLFDNLTTEVTTLKHYALSLRHENTEMKHSIAELTSSRFELTREVRQLKELISNLMEQQTLFNTSLTTIQKETKNLMRENIQIRSKYEIFQVRLKSLQERDSAQRLSIPLMSSPQQIFGAKQDGDGDQEFQLSPRLDNIVNKTTKNRLESLRKDLEDVFKKRDGYKDESPKAEKETIMEEWSNPSDLNISQTHSDRSQITTITYPHGDHSFNTAFNQGQPSSLMEQVEMLNIPQRDNFLYDAILDISPKGGSTSKSDNSKKKEGGHKKNAFSTETPRSSRDVVGNNKANNNNTDRDIMEEKKMSIPPVKVTINSQVSPQQSKHQAQLPSTASTTGVTQSSLLGPENYSYYPPYQGDGHRVDMMAPKGKVNYGYGDASIKGMEVMDMKMKKELYLKEENMLIKVLDKLDEQPYNKASSHFPGETQHHHQQQQLDSDLYRYLRPNNAKEPAGNYNFTQKMMESIGIPESEKAHPNDISTTSGTSMRGTKKLRLFRKSLKPNPSPQNSDYTNQRLHTE